MTKKSNVNSGPPEVYHYSKVPEEHREAFRRQELEFNANIKTTTKVVAEVCFSGDEEFNADPGAAAVALARLGYEVVLMPERFRPMLCLWRDDFLEASKRVNGSSFAAVMREADKMMDKVDDIVDRFGGHCGECGYVPDDYIPGFFGLVEEERRNPA